MTHVQRDITWRIYPAEGKPELLGTVRAVTKEDAEQHALKGHFHWKSEEGRKYKGPVRAWV